MSPAPSHPPIVAFLLLVAFVGLARAAELPTRLSGPTPPPKRCSINGKPGFLLPNSDICVKLSGSLSAQGAVGSTPRGQ